MVFYFLGVLSAVAVGVISTLIRVYEVTSIFSINYSKIGLHYNLIKAEWVAYKDKVNTREWIYYLIYCFVIAPLFSWLTVLSFSFKVLSNMMGKRHLPEKLKEILFKLSNQEYSKEEVLIMENEGRSFMGQQPLNEDIYNDPYSDDESAA